MSSAPKDRRPPLGRPPKHGSRALSKVIRANRLDRRTWLSKFIEQIEDRLVSPAGGHCAVNEREAMMVTLCANLWAEWQLLQWYRQQAILKGALTHDSDKYFLALVNALRRTLETLGLKPERTNDLPTLDQYLKARQTGTNGNGADGAPSPAAPQPDPAPAAVQRPPSEEPSASPERAPMSPPEAI